MPDPISMRALASGASPWWACPYVAVHGIPGDGEDQARELENVLLQVLNPGSQPATALVLFRGEGGSRDDALTKQLTIPPRSLRDHRPNSIGVRFGGWLSVSADRPVMVAGVQSRLVQVEAAAGPPLVLPERVALSFFPGHPED